MWALLHSIERIVFPWLELGLAGLGGLGVGVTFDSTDLFGHRMLPQLRGLKWEPEQVLLWEGERERENFRSFHCFSLAFFPSHISYCAVYFSKNVWKDDMHLFVILTASNIWTLFLLLAVFFFFFSPRHLTMVTKIVQYIMRLHYLHLHAPIGLMAQLDWKSF